MKFYGELLLFSLLFITNARVLFLKHAKRDSLVVIAPFSVILSILFIISWGIDVFTILALFISILVFLSNFHALFRYSARLYVDHYSPLMYIWSFFTMILSALALAAIIFFHPVELENQNLRITETRTRLTGTFKSGFDKVSIFSPARANIYQFAPVVEEGQEEEDSKIILFIPDKRSDTYYSKPYLQLLAQEGYTILSADFFASDCRWIHTIEDSKLIRRFSMVIRSMTRNQWFMLQREYYTYNISLELKAMETYIRENFGPDKQIILITDVMGNTACDDYVKQSGQNVLTTIKIDSFPEYEQPGYGFVAQTDPLAAFLLKLERDDSCQNIKTMVSKTVEIINNASGSEEIQNDAE